MTTSKDELVSWLREGIEAEKTYMKQFANRQDTGALTLEAKGKGVVAALESVLKKIEELDL